jgi:hypothetical protein
MVLAVLITVYWTFGFLVYLGARRGDATCNILREDAMAGQATDGKVTFEPLPPFVTCVYPDGVELDRPL